MPKEVEVIADEDKAEPKSVLMRSAVTASSKRPRGRPSIVAYGLSLGFALLLSLAIGYGIANDRLKLLGFTLLVATGVLPATTGIAGRRRLFVAGAILSVATFTARTFPYGITLSELVFVSILLAGVLRPLPQCGLLLRKDIRTAVYLPVVALTLVAGAAAVAHGDITYWHIVYAMPLLILLVAFQLVRSPADAHRLLIAPVVAVAGLEIVVLLAKYFGTLVEGGAESFRFGFTAVALGPFSFFETTPLPMGAVLALCASPLIALSTAENSSVWTRWTCRALFPTFAILVTLTGSRGPVVAFVVSASVTALLLLRTRKKALLLGVLCVGVFACAFFAFPSATATRLSERSAMGWTRVVGSDSSGARRLNATFRVDVVRESFGALRQHPFGRGFDYLWGIGVDETIVYSMPMNGMGIAGIVVMGVILLSACVRFLQRLFDAQDRATREIATVGMASLLAALIAGLSTTAVLSGQIAATLVWFVGSICYAGLTRVVPGRRRAA